MLKKHILTKKLIPYSCVFNSNMKKKKKESFISTWVFSSIYENVLLSPTLCIYYNIYIHNLLIMK